MTEVGSNSMYCRKGFQSACCETDTSSMELYGKCHWGPAPNCSPGCAGSETYLAWSSTGSGGAVCKKSDQGWDTRSYCCSAQEENSKWDDCQMYADIGFGPAKSQGFCRSGCPADRVRVSMDSGSPSCKSGAISNCCVPKSQTVTRELTLEDKRFEYALREFLSNRNGYCSNNELFGRKNFLDGVLFDANLPQDPTVTSSHDKIRLYQAHR
jgi:chitinase